MDSSVSPKHEIWFLHVCHHVSAGLYYFCILGVTSEWKFWSKKSHLRYSLDHAKKLDVHTSVRFVLENGSSHALLLSIILSHRTDERCWFLRVFSYSWHFRNRRRFSNCVWTNLHSSNNKSLQYHQHPWRLSIGEDRMRPIPTNSDRCCCACPGRKLASSSTPHLITMLTTSVKSLLKVSQPTNDGLVFLVPVFTLWFSYGWPALSSVNLVP